MDSWERFIPSVAASMPSLAVLDDRCRCSVCKEYLQGPMMTLCGHTFCSLCIRRALNADGRCPTCRSLEEEGRLRKNLMIEEIVEAFLPFREGLMRFAKDKASIAVDAETDNVRQPLCEDSAGDSGDDSVRPASSPLHQSTPRAKRTMITRAADKLRCDTTDELSAGHIRCPVCQSAIHSDKADYHVNRCLEGKATPPPRTIGLSNETATDTDQKSQYFNTETKTEERARSGTPSTKNGPATSLKRLPKITYSTMSDAKLRKVMIEMGINSVGTRTQLQKRCTEFITMWNSNLDSKYPKAKRELLHDMRSWDRIQAKPILKFSNEEIDVAHESGKYNDNFSDLITQARASLKKRKFAETAEDGTEL